MAKMDRKKTPLGFSGVFLWKGIPSFQISLQIIAILVCATAANECHTD